MLAIALVHRFSIMEPVREGIGLARQMLLAYDLDRFVASIRVLDLAVDEIWADKQKLKEAIVREGKLAIDEDGADVIVMGCGYMASMAAELQKEPGVPVIEPGAAAIRFAEMLVTGELSHSKQAYMTPPSKRRRI